MSKRAVTVLEAARSLAESTEALQARLSGMLVRLREVGAGAEQEDREQVRSEPSLHTRWSGASYPNK